jgi:signal transduction histidine kinase
LVSGDPNRLQQVFSNLLSNAIKFTPEGGQIEVSMGYADSNVTVSVKDTGMGIRPDLMPRLFDPFVQGDSSSTRAYSGLGLGLAIVRRLVELHHGQIHAESGGPGQGATFSVSLPVKELEAKAS